MPSIEAKISKHWSGPRCKAAFFLGYFVKVRDGNCMDFLVDTEGMLCLNVDIPMIFFLITKPAIKTPQFAQGMNRTIELLGK